MNENEIKDVNPHADEIQALEKQIADIDVNTLDPSDNGRLKQETKETKEEVKTEVKTETKETEETDPIKTELERVKGQTQGKSQKEKFEYKLKRELAQAQEMGIEIESLLGKDANEDEPVTRKDLVEALETLKPITKSAHDMALEVENEAERELYLHYLDNAIKPSGNAEQDFQVAKTMVDGVKLKNQIKMNDIRPEVQRTSTANSIQPIKTQSFDGERLTPEEQLFFDDARVRGVPLTKEEIIKMRK